MALYDLLARVDPSPIGALNRAVAVCMRDGPEVGLAVIESLLEQGSLDDYHLAHAARADMQRRLGLAEAAQASCQRALELTHQSAERRFLRARLAELARGSAGAHSLNDKCLLLLIPPLPTERNTAHHFLYGQCTAGRLRIG